MVVFVAFETSKRVLTIGITTYRTGEITILGIYRQRGVELQHILQEITRSSRFRSAAEGEVLTDSHFVIEELIVAVRTSRETIEIRIFDDTVIAVVTEGEETATFLTTVGNGDVIVLNPTRTSSLFIPIGISRRSSTGFVQVLIHRDTIENRIALVIVFPIIVVSKGVTVRIQAVIDICLPHDLTELFGVEHLHLIHIHLRGDRSIQGDIEFALRTFLRSDDDDTISSTRSVNRSGCCIFENLDRLDIIGVELVHTGFGRHTIDDIKRVVVIERTHTTDTNDSSSGRVTVRSDVHTRHFTLQRLHRVVLLLFLQVRSADCCHCTSKIRFALGRITGDYYFIEDLAVFRQLHT